MRGSAADSAIEFHVLLLALLANGLDPKDPEFTNAFAAVIIVMLVTVVGLFVWLSQASSRR